MDKWAEAGQGCDDQGLTLCTLPVPGVAAGAWQAGFRLSGLQPWG